MIVKEYDIGWGPQWPMKQLEKKIVKNFLSQYYINDSCSVIVNSVWYTENYHEQVMIELQQLRPTHVFVVAMLDPPIIDLDWFSNLGGSPPTRLLDNDSVGQALAPNPGPEQYGISNDVASLGPIDRWQKHLVNIVTETVWDIEQHNFVSEKTFKPILGLRPFLLYAANGGIKCLHSRGIEPYVTDFADIIDADLSIPYNIPVFVRELCRQPPSYWSMKLSKLRPKLLHNLEQFNYYVRQQCKF